MTRLLLLFLTVTTIGGTVFLSSGGKVEAQEIYVPKPTCVDSLQLLIDSAVPGTVLYPRTDCIYREHVDVHMPLVVDGQGEAEIRGSDVWTTWIPVNGLWISANTVPVFDPDGVCDEASDGRCLLPEQVFRDGEPLRQVANGVIPGPGEFSLNVGRQVVLAEDPADAVIEVTTRDHWLRIRSSNVTLQGFTMKHAATKAQNGAVRIDNVSDWTVQSNTLSDAHGANLYFRYAPNGQLVNNELFNGGQMGFGGRGSNILIQGNAVHNNNTEEFSTRWEAGGGKITETDELLVDGNHFYRNNGPGFWCDIDCTNVTISNNLVDHNFEVGIFFEISDGAEIYGNTVWENTGGPDERGWAGIFISSSRNANVYDNVVAWNGDGITVISQCRSFLEDNETCDTAHPWNNVYGNEIHDNVIVMGAHDAPDPDTLALGWLRDILDEDGDAYTFMFSPEARNRGYDNAYWIATGEDAGVIGFSWDDTFYVELEEFNATPGEENGVLLDEFERDEILTDAGIPTEPEDH